MKFAIKTVSILAMLLCMQITHSKALILVNGTDAAIGVWVNCNIFFDGKHKQYTLAPNTATLPLLQKLNCNVGSKDWANGFFWFDGSNFWKADELTAAEVPGVDLYVIGKDGMYSRVEIPALSPEGILRIIGDKLIELVNAFRNPATIQAFFRNIDMPEVNIWTKQAEKQNPSTLY